MESLNRLLNASHLLQGKVIALLGDANPDISDIGAVGDLIDQCRQLFDDYLSEVAPRPVFTEDYDDPNRTALIGDDETPDADPNRTVIIEERESVQSEVNEVAAEDMVSDERFTAAVEPSVQQVAEAELQEEMASSDLSSAGQCQSVSFVQDELVEPAVEYERLPSIEQEENLNSAQDNDVQEADEYISLDDLSSMDTVENGGIRVDEMLQRRVADDIRRAFTLNDKYRFRRELFGNSDVALNDALDVVSAMRSYDEARDYFVSDLGWDMENDDVKDFLDVIASHFK